MSHLLVLRRFRSLVALPILALCLILGQFFSAQAMTGGASCAVLVNQGPSKKAPLPKKLRFMTFNMENVFIQGSSDARKARQNWGHGVEFKSDRELGWEAEVVLTQNPDIWVGQEIHSQEDAQVFLNEKPELANKYDIYMVPGNDQRGINIVTFVRKGLDITIDFISHKDRQWKDPANGEVLPLFSRDLPTLVVRRTGETKPAMIFMGNHAKSKRDRDHDPESTRYRTAQYAGIAQIIKDLKAQYGDDVPMILAGDFNTDVQKAPEVAPVRDVTKSVFDSIAGTVFDAIKRVTHIFFSRDGGSDAKQMDDIRVTGNVKVISAQVVHYQNLYGREMAMPRSFQERERQPSDHYPVVADIEIP